MPAPDPDGVLGPVLAASRRDLAGASSWDVRTYAADRLFDALVCMASGSDQPGMGGLIPSWGPASVIGTSASADILTAASLNAVAAHSEDLDDLHWPSLTHQGSVIWPAVLSVAEADGIELPRMLHAGALGCQVIARLADVLGSYHRKHHHVTSTAGVVGVAAAVMVLRGGDDEAVLTAMAHAASLMGGSSQAVRQRSRTPIIHRGYAASTGILAAYGNNLRPAVCRPVALSGAATPANRDYGGGAPRILAVAETTTRRHPVTGFAHSVVDAILDVPAFDHADVRTVFLEVPNFVIDLTEPSTPGSALQAAWSVRYAAALALAGLLPAHRVVWPPCAEVIRLFDLVELLPRPTQPPDLAVRGHIVFETGPDLLISRVVPRGHPDDPLEDDELIGKAEARTALNAAQAKTLLDAVRTAGGVLDPVLIRCLGSPSRRR